MDLDDVARFARRDWDLLTRKKAEFGRETGVTGDPDR